ncbi:MAG TPA: hypothetical protein QGG18_07135 [Rhodospirillales bacterium]|nr:hypothetical protein [Rhodospirillales bacterium]
MDYNDSVIIKFNADDPIALDDLTSGFSALSSQYNKSLNDLGHKDEEANVRLYVSKISDGCIEAELTVYALIFKDLIRSMDYANIMADFTHRVGRTVRYFSGQGERPQGLTIADTKDAGKFLSSVTGQVKAGISLRKANYKNGGQSIDFEYDFNSKEIETANSAIQKELAEEPETETHKTKKNVLFVWHQINKEKGKTGGRTSDKAVITSIIDKPLAVFFPVGTDSIKRSMVHTDGNPLYGKAFMVDVNVEYHGTEPKVYTVLKMHQPVDIEDEG